MKETQKQNFFVKLTRQGKKAARNYNNNNIYDVWQPHQTNPDTPDTAAISMKRIRAIFTYSYGQMRNVFFGKV